MMFESEYRRQALECLEMNRTETEREIAEEWRYVSKSFTSVLDSMHNAFITFFPYSHSRQRQ